MPSPDDLEEKRKLFDDTIARTDRWVENSSESLNQIILIVGTGSFVISVGFISGNLEKESVTYIWWLIASWGLLLLAIVAQALRYYSIHTVSSLSHVRAIQWQEKNFVGRMESEEDENNSKVWNRISRVSMVCSMVLCVAGVIAMFVFGVANVFTQTSERYVPNKQTVTPSCPHNDREVGLP